MNRLAVPVIVLVAVATAVGVWLWKNGEGSDELRLGGYIEAEQIQVGSKLAGRVKEVGKVRRENSSAGDTEEIAVDEGAEVEAGQVLVVFETDDVDAQLAEARAETAKAAARLAELKAGTRKEEIEQAEAAVRRLTEKVALLEEGPRPQEIEQARQMFERSKAEYDNALGEYRRQVALSERGAAAGTALDAARKTMETSVRSMESDRQKHEMLKEGNRPQEIKMARHELEEADAALALARKGPRDEEKEQAQAAVDAARARVRRLEVMFNEGTVRAPLPCVVEAFDLQPGDMVAPGAPLATLVRKDQLWVRAFAPETDIGLIRDNQRVEITVDSFPDRRFPGTVLRINRIAEFTPRNVQTFKERQDMMFPLKIRVEDPDGVLRPGMAATVHVAKSG